MASARLHAHVASVRYIINLVKVAIGIMPACHPSLDDAGNPQGPGDAALGPKITQGTKTTGYPSVGYLKSGGAWCSATLVGSREVLTAAHCISGQSGQFFVGGRSRAWSKAHVHEDFDKNTLDNDLAVAVLDSPVDGVAPTKLGSAQLSKGTKLTLVGYGYTTFGGGNESGDKYVGTNTVAELGAAWFSYEGDSNNCSGDSGGPSFVDDTIVGVHSSGVGNQYCSNTGYDVRVGAYTSWIRSKLSSAPADGGTTRCADTEGFTDAQGYRCADWVGYDCATATQWGYNAAQVEKLLANCRATCGRCSDTGGTGGGGSGGGAGGGASGTLDSWRAYFGYLHSHTGVSDGAGTPAKAFERARAAGLDFFAVTDHDYYPDPMTASDWRLIQQAADQAYRPGSFVTFRGFEWTSDTTEWQRSGLGLGHMTIINTQDYCSSGQSNARTLNQLVTWLNSRDAVAMFNHPGQYGTTFDRFNFNKSDKIVGMELWNRNEDYYSKSGFTGKGYYDEALSQGFYIGAGGGQDNHDASWGSANEWRIGVLATELTRESILGAFRARRFYSVRDRNLAVSLVCGGAPMGSRIGAGSMTCTVKTRDGNGEATTRIDLVHKGRSIKTWSPNNSQASVSTQVQTRSGDYLYARVYQGGSWTAITAPIFFR